MEAVLSAVLRGFFFGRWRNIMWVGWLTVRIIGITARIHRNSVDVQLSA